MAAGPASYRRVRIVDYVQRLIWRKESIAEQLGAPELQEQRENLIGQIQAIDLIVREMTREFGIDHSEFT